jgi:hypothetical protein
MFMRRICAFALAGLMVIGVIGQAADTFPVSSQGKGPSRKVGKKGNMPHGSFALGLSGEGFRVTIQVKSAEDGPFRPFAAFPVFGTNPFFCSAIGLPAEVLTGCLLNHVKQPKPAGSTKVEPKYTCPYLKQQQQNKNLPTATAESCCLSVTERLEQLEHAHRLYHRAEHYRRAAKTEAAVRLYQQVHRLCPGSRIDADARARLRELGAPENGPTGPAGGEEQETPRSKIPHTCHKVTDQPHVEKQVDQLLEAAHQALLAGNYYRAEKLANRVLRLNADCVAAHPLVYKMHLLSQVQEHAMKSMPSVPTVPRKKQNKPAVRNRSLRPRCPEALRTALPPIDPGIVLALDKVLTESTEAAPRKLVVVVEEGGGNEEQPEPIPTLKEVPEEANLTIEAEKPEAAVPESPGQTAPDMREFLHDLLTTLGGGMCVDVDCSRPAGVRARCALQVGGVDVQLLWNGAEPQCRVIEIISEK